MKKKKNLAFTLVELLLAAAILVFVLSGMLALFVKCLALNEANRNLTIAVSHAQYVMEEMKNTAFSGLKTQIDAGSWDWNAAAITSRGLTALKDETINTDTIGSETNPLDVQASVSWKDSSSRERNIALRSLFTPY